MNLTQGVYTNITVYSVITNVSVANPFNLSVQGGKNYSLNGTATNIYLREGQMNFTWSKMGWYNLSFSKNVTALTNTTANATGAFDQIININVFNITGSLITILTNISLSLPIYNTSQLTTNGSSQFTGLSGYNYTFYVDTTGFAITNASFIPSSSNYTYNFTLFLTNSFNFSIYDEETNSIITTDNFTIELHSNYFSNNYSTTTSYLNVSLLVPGDYEIRYYTTAGNYNNPRSYYITLINRSFNTIRLYAVKDVNSTFFIPVVYDSDMGLVSDQTIQLIRGYIENNGTIGYVVEMAKTDPSGQAVLRIIPNTVYYKFIISGSAGSLVTNYFKVTASTLDFKVSKEQSYLTSGYLFSQFPYNFTFIDATNTYSLTWIDSTGTISNGCLEVNKKKGVVETNVYSGCVASSSGNIIYTVTDFNQTSYLAKATFTTTTTYSNKYDSLGVSFITNYISWGLWGILLTCFITVTLMFLASSGGNAAGVLLGGMAGVVICGIIGLIAWEWTSFVGIAIIVGVMIYKMRV